MIVLQHGSRKIVPWKFWDKLRSIVIFAKMSNFDHNYVHENSWYRYNNCAFWNRHTYGKRVTCVSSLAHIHIGEKKCDLSCFLIFQKFHYDLTCSYMNDTQWNVSAIEDHNNGHIKTQQHLNSKQTYISS